MTGVQTCALPISYTYANMHFEGIQSAARRAQMAYYKSYKRGRNAKGRSYIARDEMEIEVICCYMRGWGIEQTVKWLLEQKEYNASLSAVGRYWKRLRAAGVLPVHKLSEAVMDEKDIIEHPLSTAK